MVGGYLLHLLKAMVKVKVMAKTKKIKVKKLKCPESQKNTRI